MRGSRFLKRMDLIVGTALILILFLFLRRKRKVLSGQPKKILVLKLAALGDTLLLVPTLRAMRAGTMRRALFMAKGSLFLGRMTEASDGVSFLLET